MEAVLVPVLDPTQEIPRQVLDCTKGIPRLGLKGYLGSWLKMGSIVWGLTAIWTDIWNIYVAPIVVVV